MAVSARARKAQKSRRVSKSRTPSKEELRRSAAIEDGRGVIEAGKSYHVAVFQRLTGLGDWALRKAEREGLPIRVVGVDSYVLGDDWLAHLASVEPGKRSRHAPRGEGD